MQSAETPPLNQRVPRLKGACVEVIETLLQGVSSGSRGQCLPSRSKFLLKAEKHVAALLRSTRAILAIRETYRRRLT